MEDAVFSSLVTSLLEAVGRVEAKVRDVPADRWGEVIHTGDGAWTRRQLLAHMAANDLRQLIRVRIGAGIAAPGDEVGRAEELEGDTWNMSRVAERAGREVEELVMEMRANRQSLIALLRTLTPAQRASPMPFRGRPTPLEAMVPALIGHLDAHAAELTVIVVLGLADLTRDTRAIL